MEQLQVATLTLHTSSLENDENNANGEKNVYNSVITWKNINLRLLLGDMYNKFDFFNLELINITCDDNRDGELISGNLQCRIICV
jgi:hypothetical protein